jgi:integrase
LQDLITAALETGCRRGELLSLQWHQVRFSPRAEIYLPAGKTKAKRDRRIPISSVLLDADAPTSTRRGMIPPDGYVFGDEIGRRRGSIGPRGD